MGLRDIPTTPLRQNKVAWGSTLVENWLPTHCVGLPQPATSVAHPATLYTLAMCGVVAYAQRNTAVLGSPHLTMRA